MLAFRTNKSETTGTRTYGNRWEKCTPNHSAMWSDITGSHSWVISFSRNLRISQVIYVIISSHNSIAILDKIYNSWMMADSTAQSTHRLAEFWTFISSLDVPSCMPISLNVDFRCPCFYYSSLNFSYIETNFANPTNHCSRLLQAPRWQIHNSWCFLSELAPAIPPLKVRRMISSTWRACFRWTFWTTVLWDIINDNSIQTLSFRDWYVVQSSKLSSNCAQLNCYLTWNRHFFSHLEFDISWLYYLYSITISTTEFDCDSFLFIFCQVATIGAWEIPAISVKLIDMIAGWCKRSADTAAQPSEKIMVVVNPSDQCETNRHDRWVL